MRLRKKLIKQKSSLATTEKNLKLFNFEVLTVNERAEEVKREKAQARYFTEDLGNDVILDMIAIPGGKFLMGTEDEEIEKLCRQYSVEYFRAEKPQHEVTFQPFALSKYPITQAQYKQIMSNNPSRFQGKDRPVEKVSWDEAVEFCQRLSQNTRTEYRLPTEAEWEYACRAGTTTAFHFGETITDKLVNFYRTVEQTTAVGKYPPNAFGLYDMHGNVWEWCQDNWHDNYKDAPNDGKARVLGKNSIKVIRGGSWGRDPYACRSAYRDKYRRDARNDSFGFRVVCVVLRTTEEVIMVEQEKPVARLLQPSTEEEIFADMKQFRESLSLKGGSLSQTIINARQEERY